jgi:serine/threonine protein kinase
MASSVAGNGRSVVGERIADRYELEELVGSGGMSSVYRAHDQLLDRKVALKILHSHYNEDAEYVERFRREARSVARLSHPNIVTVIDRGEEDGRQFIVFEYVPGENLKELVDRSGALPVRRALELALQVARGLAFAHDQGLVHRDVKPQNVLLNGEGEAKVTDFGIARSLDVEHGMTQTGTVLGTSNYIAPEQASGRPVDAHTDVYSLGAVLHELLTGEVPFPGDNFVSVAMKHINEPPPDLMEKRPDVPLRVAAIVDRALQKDPGDRFPSMHDFAAELDAALHELGSPDTDRTAIVPSSVVRESRPRPMRSRSRWPLLLTALALVAAAAVLAGVLTLGGSNGKKPAAAGGPAPANVHLRAVADFDPYGGDGEHQADVPKATDGDVSSAWTTSSYYSGLGKPGVGIIVDAGKPVELKRLIITTDTPGYRAQIRITASPTGPLGAVDSPTRTVSGTTAFALTGATSRYYNVWITDLGGLRQAHINEVRAG